MVAEEVVELISECLVTASSTFPADKMRAYERAIASAGDESSAWLLKLIAENARIAADMRSPLCDDTGIPHVVIDVGPGSSLEFATLQAVELGVAEGLRRLPGRPMAVKGDQEERLAQSLGMYDDPAEVQMAPIAVRRVNDPGVRAHVLMFGGGPAIRGRSFRVFHRHDASVVESEIVSWAIEACSLLGCTPSTLAVGIGRSHYEAANLMLQAQVDGSYDAQSPFEQRLTRAVNESGIGALGMGGSTTVLATFAKIGPARASGVRIVCMRPCCCFEPRVATVELGC